jgi:hypothetical protein
LAGEQWLKLPIASGIDASKQAMKKTLEDHPSGSFSNAWKTN